MPVPSLIHTQLTDAKMARPSNPSPNRDFFARDTELRGFDLRMGPGNVSFIVEATVQGRFVRRVLGRYPLDSDAEARKSAKDPLRLLG